jgi:hypothetical protein
MSKPKTPKLASLKIRKRRSTRLLSSKEHVLLKGASPLSKHKSQVLSLSRSTNNSSSSKKTVVQLQVETKAPPRKERNQGSTRKT